MIISKVLKATALFGSLVSVHAHAAIVYSSTSNVGAATATISVTTDGSLGPLAPQGGVSVHNVPAITDWTVSLTTPYGSMVFGKNIAAPRLTTVYNAFFFVGQAFSPDRTVLTATPTQMSLNPSFAADLDQGIYLRVLDPFTYLDRFHYVAMYNRATRTHVQTIVFKDEYGIQRNFSDVNSAPLKLMASVGSAVPEPATWAMMIAGFGMVGAGMRRRKVTPALA